MLNESVTSEPMLIEWLFADRNCSRPFSITTDSPNVTSSVVRTPRLSAALAWLSKRPRGQAESFFRCPTTRAPKPGDGDHRGSVAAITPSHRP
jgi:hypothetical protein